MEVFITRSLRGEILGVYVTLAAARQHLVSVSVYADQDFVWLRNELLVNGRYVGRVEVATVRSEYRGKERGDGI